MGFVGFVEASELPCSFGEFAGDDDEEAGGERVERAAVADFDFTATGLMRGNHVSPHRAVRRQSRRLGLLPFFLDLFRKLAADAGDDAETGHVGGFIDKDDLVGIHEEKYTTNLGKSLEVGF